MLIKSCFDCKYHEIKEESVEKFSRCVRENCYAQYSKCIAGKALFAFLQQENPDRLKTLFPARPVHPVE